MDDTQYLDDKSEKDCGAASEKQSEIKMTGGGPGLRPFETPHPIYRNMTVRIAEPHEVTTPIIQSASCPQEQELDEMFARDWAAICAQMKSSHTA